MGNSHNQRQSRDHEVHMASGFLQPFIDVDQKQRQLLQLQDELWVDESERFLDLLEVQAGERVICWGAGLGLDLPRLARRVGNSGEVVAVEHNPLLAEEARALVKERRLSRVTVVIGDLVVEPVPAGPYQLSFCSWHQGSALAGPRSAGELEHLMQTLSPLLDQDSRLGFWEYGLDGLRVAPGTPGLNALQQPLSHWLQLPNHASSIERLPGAFLSRQILLQKAWPTQQAGPPGCRLHRFLELRLQLLLDQVGGLSESEALQFWKDWEQSKVDPLTLVYSSRNMALIGQRMKPPTLQPRLLL